MLNGQGLPAAVSLAPATAGAHAAHLPALLALLYLPIAVVAFFIACDAMGRLGIGPAQWFLARFSRSPSPARAVALLLLVTAAVHAGLVPGHFGVDPLRSSMFALDALAMVGLAGWAVSAKGWQPAAVFLLAANLGLYAYYVLNGWEALEAIGVFTKLVEVTCAGLILVPLRIGRPSHRLRQVSTA